MAGAFRTAGGKALVLDGATGTQLQSRGMPAGCCVERWVLDHPEAILEIQRSYVLAGAGAVYAPTFGANRAVLGRHGLGDRVAEYNRRLVDLSRKAAADRAMVGGDLSTTGLLMPPAGETSFGDLEGIFREQAEALEQAGVDFFAVETQLTLGEARAAVTAIRQVSRKPVLCSFPFDRGGRTLCGGDLRGILVSLEALGIDAFGINCVGDLDALEEMLAVLRPYTALPLLAKPNAGMPVTRAGRTEYRLPPETLEEHARRFIRRGADILGGCCGTREEHVRALCRAAEAEPLPGRPVPEETWYACEYSVVPDSLPAGQVAAVSLDGEFEDNAREAVLDGARMLRVVLEEEGQLEELLEAQGLVKVPLWVRCSQGAMRARFLREYSGKAKMD